MHSRLFTRVQLGHVSRTRIRAAQDNLGRCHCCGVRVQPGEVACGEHSSDLFTPAEMKAMYVGAMRVRN